LVPLSVGWTGSSIVLVTPRDSPTVRNLTVGGRIRVAMGPTRDVVLIIAEVVRVDPLDAADSSLLDVFAEQSGWDPRRDSDSAANAAVELRPVVIQAWREVNEIKGRTLMRDGSWPHS